MKMNWRGIKNLGLVLSVMLLVAFMAGCRKSPAEQLLGTWTLDAAKSGSIASQITGAGGSTLTFTKDQKFKMAIGKIPADGSYSVSGQTVTMNIEDFMGLKAPSTDAAKNTMQASLSDDGKSLSISVKGSPTIVYKKSE